MADDEKDFESTSAGVCPKCGAAIVDNAGECTRCRTILLDKRTSREERLSSLQQYSLGEMLLREREYLLETIYSRERLPAKISYYAGFAFVFSFVYGIFFGCAWGWKLILLVAFKVPLFLFSGLVICMPLLYTFNIFIGSRLSFIQTVTVLSLSTYLMGVVLIAFSPILLLFVLFSGSPVFVNILNIMALLIAVSLGLGLLWNVTHYFIVKNCYRPNMILLKIWSGLYLLVAVQLFWSLRMFVAMGQLGVMDRLGQEWNFYEALFHLIKGILGTPQ